MALFKVNGSTVRKIIAKDLNLERNLQELFEANLEEILSIIFLKHEHSTSFGGRIDTLGIDKNGSPCIIEYKKNQNDNVINQGLSYLRWLLDHVVKQYGLKIFLNVKSGQLNDPQKLARDLTKPKPIGHWGNGDYEVKLESANKADAVFALIKQSYDLNK